jgi:N-hydroxyarylamine O-acetyltransferase
VSTRHTATTSMWQGDDVDLDAYLARVGHQGPVAPDIDTLRALQGAHVDAIPFDNLDALLGRAEVPLDLGRVQDKLVRSRRGGWCLEHVVLVAAVLERIGFAFSAFAARTRVRTGSTTGAAIHLALLVDVDDRTWILDVGFGALGPREPVLLAEGAPSGGDWPVDVVREPRGERVLRLLRPEGPLELYGFTTDARYPADLEVANHFCLTHPRSPFNHRMVLQRTRPAVRHMLVGTTLSEFRPGLPTTHRDLDGDEALAAPADVFGIALGPGELATLRARLAGAAGGERP